MPDSVLNRLLADTEEDRLVDALAQSAFATVAILSRLAKEHDLSVWFSNYSHSADCLL